jgi:hypothetical protein
VNQGRILLFDQHTEKLYKALSKNLRRSQISAVDGYVMWKRKDVKRATVTVSLHTLISCEKLRFRTRESGPELALHFYRTIQGHSIRARIEKVFLFIYVRLAGRFVLSGNYKRRQQSHAAGISVCGSKETVRTKSRSPAESGGSNRDDLPQKLAPSELNNACTCGQDRRSQSSNG